MAIALVTTADTVYHYVMTIRIATVARNVSTAAVDHYAQQEINVLKGKYVFRECVCPVVTLIEIVVKTCYVHLNFVLRRAAKTLVVKTLCALPLDIKLYAVVLADFRETPRKSVNLMSVCTTKIVAPTKSAIQMENVRTFA